MHRKQKCPGKGPPLWEVTSFLPPHRLRRHEEPTRWRGPLIITPCTGLCLRARAPPALGAPTARDSRNRLTSSFHALPQGPPRWSANPYPSQQHPGLPSRSPFLPHVAVGSWVALIPLTLGRALTTRPGPRFGPENQPRPSRGRPSRCGRGRPTVLQPLSGGSELPVTGGVQTRPEATRLACCRELPARAGELTRPISKVLSQPRPPCISSR